MRRYALVRVSQALATLLFLSVVVFLSVRVTGDPAAYLIGPEGTVADYERLKRSMGLDRPLPIQYASFVADIVRGDLGNSLITRRPVGELLLERLPETAKLASAAFAITLVFGIPLGVLSAVHRDSLVDGLSKLFAVLGIAAPSFWVAIMLIFLFGGTLRWLPTFGSGGLDHLILPAFVLGWHGTAGMVRLARSSMLEVLGTEYVRFARAKGLPERLVTYRHAMRNALIPLLTYSGLLLANLLNGSVIVDVVFAWPGVGLLMLEGISRRDFPVVQAAVLAAGGVYVVVALVVDILYAYVNPRIRLS
jgi:peptide/nickel transport system permease protein